MKQTPQLTSLQREYGQRYALLANFAATVTMYIVVGAMMMLFTNDVLGFSPQRIASILALIPLISIVRIGFLSQIQAFGRVRTMFVSGAIRALVLLLLILIPIDHLSFSLYVLLLLIYQTVNQIGAGSVWQPLMRDITTTNDRGQFFARMRFVFTLVRTAVIGIIPWFIGERITAGQYKVLLGIALLGLCNHIYWIRRIPEIKRSDDDESVSPIEEFRRIWNILRTTTIIRRPLLLFALHLFAQFPLYLIYLRQMLNVPANIVSVHTFFFALGTALSLLVWGKIADTIGFRPLWAGVTILAIVLLPLQLFLTPFPTPFPEWQALPSDALLNMVVLMVIGLINGMLLAGHGIAHTSIMHHYVKSEDALPAMNLFDTASTLLIAVYTFFCGFLLQEVAIPWGIHQLGQTSLHVDAVRAYLLLFGIPLHLLALWQLSKLPNIRPYFGLNDFFTSITPMSLLTMLAQRHVFHEDERKRAETARWLGARNNPMMLEPLFDMLNDPSYDVKAEAIRSLAFSGSPLAGERLLDMLRTPEMRVLWDHVAWALGELSYTPARETLIAALAESYPYRTRAMAARSLGKLGCATVRDDLLKILRTPINQQHLTSSACLALIQIDGIEEPTLLFDTFARFTDRIERYELMESLCKYIGIPNDWLIRHRGHQSLHQAMHEMCIRKPLRWRKKREALIEQIERKDNQAVIEQVQTALPLLEPEERHVIEGLLQALRKLDRWQALSVLAASWLLLHET